MIISWTRGHEKLILRKYLQFAKINYSRLLFLKALHRRCSTRFWVCLRFWIAQNFEHVPGSESVSILHVPAFWICLCFWICQDSKYWGLGTVNLDITFWCFVFSSSNLIQKLRKSYPIFVKLLTCNRSDRSQFYEIIIDYLLILAEVTPKQCPVAILISKWF